MLSSQVYNECYFVHLEKFRCARGVLAICCCEEDLEPFLGNFNLDIKGSENEKVISLREAASLVNPKNEFHSSCNCKSKCVNKRCLCKKRGFSCSSKCHGGNSCSNQLYSPAKCSVSFSDFTLIAS